MWKQSEEEMVGVRQVEEGSRQAEKVASGRKVSVHPGRVTDKSGDNGKYGERGSRNAQVAGRWPHLLKLVGPRRRGLAALASSMHCPSAEPV